MHLVDSHCHIDGEQFDVDRDDVVERAREAGVAAMLCVGTGDPHAGEVAKAVATADRYENVFAAVGVHPHDAKLYDDEAESHLIELASRQKVVGWGEIGLDFHYDHSPRDVQQDVFRRQIRVAKGLGLPIIVHSRSANDETVAILREEYSDSSQDDIPGVMHCFGGTAEMAKELLAIGFFISFAGNVTFKKADDLREAARAVPLERLLIETDCPYLTPVPLRGKRNEPAFLLHTAQFLAEFYGVSTDAIARHTTANFCRLFGIEASAID
ncbi:MAG: TatD family hydrolase [Acidobacteria bacterium OLB17]|nr:MAG: TatD family hydrolase [Acidobacteria bacterium OLB17]MCZ2389547.1 TatD family hydrolase [Acidobacteriota bacterium]